MTIDAVYLLQLTLNGITLGLLYALIAVGLSLIFGVMEIINFAHGELLMLGAFAMTFALPVFGLLYWPALATAILGVMLAGFVIYELLLVRLRPDEFERSILITLGLSIVVIHAMQYFFTATPRMVDTQYGFEGVNIGAIRITWTRLIGAGAALVAFAGLWVLLRHTQFGRAMRAIAQNREAALMVGIRPRVVARNAVVLASGLCGLAGAAISPIQLVTPYMGQFLIFKAFALVIIGGLGNIPGAVVAAIGLGLVESWIGGFFTIAWQEAAVFVIMIGVLMVRPDGLFKQRRHARRMKLAIAPLPIALVVAAAFGTLPLLTSSNYILGVGVSALVFTVAAAALNLIYGFTGLLSFAQLGFWGIGGYASALTVVSFGGNFWSGILWAALINAVVALLFGYPTLRTNRHAFVIVDSDLRAARHPDRARLGRSHARAARHSQPAAAQRLRPQLRGHP